MPIDASIYNNVRPNPISLPSPLDTAEQGMRLSQLGMQVQTQQALRQAYANNVGPDGQLNRAGVLTDLNRVNPMAGMQVQQQWSQFDKQQAEAKEAQAKAEQAAVGVALPALQHLDSVPDDQKPTVYHSIMKDLADKGLPMHNVPSEFKPEWLASTLDTLKNTPTYLEQQKSKADALKSYAEIGKIRAETGAIGDKQLQALKDDLDPNKARGGNLAKSQSVVNAADRLNAMFQQFPDYNIPKAQQTELVSAFGSMLNGGSAPFVSQLDELVPKSIRGNANALASWITNEPTGAEQQKFMQLLHDSVNRERDVATMQVKTAQVQRLPSHELIMRKNPNGSAAVLGGYGIDPSDIKGGKYAPGDPPSAPLAGAPASGDLSGPGGTPAAQSKPSASLIPDANAAQARDPQIAQWAKSHALPYNQALSIIQARRRGKNGG